MSESWVADKTSTVDAEGESIVDVHYGTLADKRGKSVLVVAAHPDDETIGCGGTIARHTAEGDAVHILIMADGAAVRGLEKERIPRYGGEIKKEAESSFNSPGWANGHKAAHLLGVDSITILNRPDSRFDSVDLLDLAKDVELLIDEFQPEIVYTHHGGDLNYDHQATHHAVVIACRPKPKHPVKELYFFEVASSTEWTVPGSLPPFLPHMFVDISKHAELKETVLTEAYGREMRSGNHPRSIDGIAARDIWRGSSSGLSQAEAFMVGRIIR